jgi:fructokinase
MVDAVGAGDAFASVLLLGLRLGWPLATTMDRAQAFASELVQRRGATVSDPALYATLARRWEL